MASMVAMIRRLGFAFCSWLGCRNQGRSNRWPRWWQFEVGIGEGRYVGNSDRTGVRRYVGLIVGFALCPDDGWKKRHS